MKVDKLNKLLESIDVTHNQWKAFDYKTKFRGEDVTAHIYQVERVGSSRQGDESSIDCTYRELFNFLGRPNRYSIEYDEIYWVLSVEIDGKTSFSEISNYYSISKLESDSFQNNTPIVWGINSTTDGISTLIKNFLEEGIDQNRALPKRFSPLNKRIDLE